jgi:hypothetical protein
MLLGDRDSGGFSLGHCYHALRAGQSKKCFITTWLAFAWLRRGITCRGKDLGKFPCTVEAITCAVCLDLG